MLRRCLRSRFVAVRLRNFSSIASALPQVTAADFPTHHLEGITIVNDEASAVRALAELARVEGYHAADTEVMDIELKTQSPVGNGKVICASIYCGEQYDFGNGPLLWIDNLDPEGVLMHFKDYFEDKSIKKVWHNYSFDRAVLYNHGIDVQGFGGDTMHMSRLHNAARRGYSLEVLSKKWCGPEFQKMGMKERFSKANTKRDGTPGKLMTLPPVENLQRFERDEWIRYSVLDAKATFRLREVMEKNLKEMHWNPGTTMFDFYQRKWLPFAEILTDMERHGFFVKDKDYLPQVEQTAIKDQWAHENTFRNWAATKCPGTKYMNVNSSIQKAQFFFGKKNPKDPLPEFSASVEDFPDYEFPEGKRPTKSFKFTLSGQGMRGAGRTTTGAVSASGPVLAKLAGSPSSDPPKWGTAYESYRGGEEGKNACRAIDALLKAGSIKTLLTTFIKPLQLRADENHRIHCSLNLNTETGRLSARNPNLQNQPALEKDIYKIRAAFAAPPGKTLLVADYGQLELRLLAHMTKCKSMISAFLEGGDFHSRTAIGMYPYIRKAIAEKEVLLEWDNSKGESPVPLVKDVYATERRKAKTLNFSIAYGKTAKGLAADWGVTFAEAQNTVNLWYADRPEVAEWQEKMRVYARKHGRVRTLMGRYRDLPEINSDARGLRHHAERAAINTPIQGGAADVVVQAMLNLHANDRFRELGWRLVLQVHDEVIAEGPAESVAEAQKILLECMEHPFKNPLLVPLSMDCNHANTWYDAK